MKLTKSKLKEIIREELNEGKLDVVVEPEIKKALKSIKVFDVVVNGSKDIHGDVTSKYYPKGYKNLYEVRLSAPSRDTLSKQQLKVLVNCKYFISFALSDMGGSNLYFMKPTKK